MPFYQSKVVRLSAFSAMLLCSTAIALPAYAAEADQTAISDAEGGNDIVVTARKRVEKQRDVPNSVTALNASKLAEQGAVRLEDYYARVPGLALNDQGDGRTAVSIRGLSTGMTLRAGVATLIDDIPVTPTGGTSVTVNLVPDVDPAILDRVEVLKGPQGTLFGAGTIGGLVNYVTTKPSTTNFSGSAQADVNSVEHGGIGYSMRANAQIPVIRDKLGVSVSGLYRHEAGFVNETLQSKNDANSTDTYGGRIAALFKYAETGEITASALIYRQDIDDPATIATDYNFNQVQGGLNNNHVVGSGPISINVNLYSLKIRQEVLGAELTSITGYMKNSYRGVFDFGGRYAAAISHFGVNGIASTYDFNVKKFTQEVRLSAENGPIEWLVGGFYTKEKNANYNYRNAVDPATGQIAGLYQGFDYPATYREAAAFADVIVHISDRFSVEGGLRYSKNWQSYEEVGYGYAYPTSYRIYNKSNDNVVTYQIAPKFKLNDDLMAYVRVASGYRPGGPQTGAVAVQSNIPTSVGPDTVVNYEAGIKGSWLDGRLTADLAAYYVDWNDIQVSQTLGSYGTYQVNAGKARSTGFEGSITARPLQWLNIGANLSYNNAKLTRTSGLGFTGQKGDPLPFMPEWSGAVSFEARQSVGDGVDAVFGGQFSYIGDRWNVFPSSTTQVRQLMPSYTTIDLRAGVDFAAGWQVNLYVKNLTDSRGVLNSTPRLGTASTTALYDTAIIRPRTIGASLSMKY